MQHETAAETVALVPERVAAALTQQLAPLAKIGTQLEQLNRNLEMLARLLEKQAPGRPPFRGPKAEHRPPWKRPRRHWEPRHAEPEHRGGGAPRPMGERHERERTGPRHDRNR
jgi:hypothetical protein